MFLNRRAAAVCTLAFSGALLAGAVSFAQQVPAGTAQASRQVTLDVVVTAHAGEPIAGLKREDLTVLDNKTARPVTSFAARSGRDAPVEVIVLIDAVNAGYETVAYERDGIDKFLMASGGELAQPVTLAVLTDKGTEIQDGGSRDGKVLKATLDRYDVGLRTIRRSEGFYGAEDRLNLSLAALDNLLAREEKKPGRKLIVWISPGWPLFSGPGIQLSSKQQDGFFQKIAALSTRLRKAQVTLYSVNPLGTGESLFRADYYKSFLQGVSKPSNVDLGDLALPVLATQTGGLAITSNNDVNSMLQRAMDDTKAYYEVSFEAAPGEHADEYHSIEVQVDKPGLSARTRTGYYAQP